MLPITLCYSRMKILICPSTFPSQFASSSQPHVIPFSTKLELMNSAKLAAVALHSRCTALGIAIRTGPYKTVTENKMSELIPRLAYTTHIHMRHMCRICLWFGPLELYHQIVGDSWIIHPYFSGFCILHWGICKNTNTNEPILKGIGTSTGMRYI